MKHWVLLFHWGALKADHFDLMIEEDGVLKTWSFSDNPLTTLKQDGKRIFDHPIKFLTYQGKLSGDKGFCKRIEGGTVGEYICNGESFSCKLKGAYSHLKIKVEGKEKVTLKVKHLEHDLMKYYDEYYD